MAETRLVLPRTFIPLILLASFLISLSTIHCLEIIADVDNLGNIRGQSRYSELTFKPYVGFYGIPYAEAPEEEARFLVRETPHSAPPPEPINRELDPSGTFNATLHRSNIKCVQPRLFGLNQGKPQKRGTVDHENLEVRQNEDDESSGSRAYDGDEDCLVVNVFTPKLPADGGSDYPVIFFVHGGAFINGQGLGIYSPGRMMENDVVLVTVNYRLGVLGFFSLDINDAPGNAAFYDLVVALHWVQNYISFFGGNPDLVTAAGQSAGAAAVSYLMLSQMTQVPKPLFHRAITLSGSALNTWAINESPRGANLKIAKMANCTETDNEDELTNADLVTITNCMKDADPDLLVSVLADYQNNERREGRLGADAVSPVIQRSNWDTPFITKHPLSILEEGAQLDIPLLAASTKHDGSFPLGVVYNRYLNCRECENRLTNPEFLKYQLIPTLLKAMGIVDSTGEIYTALAEKYLKTERLSGNFSEMVYGLLDIHSVFFFKAGVHKSVELHSRLNPHTYFYSFEYAGEYSVFELLFLGNMPDVPGGIAHGDDLIYLLVPELEFNAEDQEISYKMIDHWINFAISGDPNPTTHISDEESWPPFDETSRLYLQLSEKSNIIGVNYPGSWENASAELRPILDVITTTVEPVEGSTAPVEETTGPVEETTAPAEEPTTSEFYSTSTKSSAPISNAIPNQMIMSTILAIFAHKLCF